MAKQEARRLLLQEEERLKERHTTKTPHPIGPFQEVERLMTGALNLVLLDQSSHRHWYQQSISNCSRDLRCFVQLHIPEVGLVAINAVTLPGNRLWLGSNWLFGLLSAGRGKHCPDSSGSWHTQEARFPAYKNAG